MEKEKALYLSQYNATFKAVNSFFNSEYTSKAWMLTQNPLLGGVTPDEMLLAGRFDKLIDFIYTQLGENKR